MYRPAGKSNPEVTEADREAADAVLDSPINAVMCMDPRRDLRDKIAALRARAREEGAKTEREACALLCDKASGSWGDVALRRDADGCEVGADFATARSSAMAACAAAIRARSVAESG